MRIVWRSPWGAGWSIAYKLRTLGHKVVYCGPEPGKPGSLNGQGYLPAVPTTEWEGYAKKAELVVVDDNWASRPTRRSWSPSDEVLTLQQLRRKGIPILGPSPTTELLEYDERYRAKMLRRLGIGNQTGPISPAGPDNGEVVHLTIGRDPGGGCYLVWRHRNLLSDGNGPELGNLGDVSIPTSSQPITDLLDKFQALFGRSQHQSYLNIDMSVREVGAKIRSFHARFIYPAIFAQLAYLLDGDAPTEIGSSVTLLRLDEKTINLREDVLQQPGFYGAELHRDVEAGKASVVAHGAFIGAVAVTGPSLTAVQQKINSYLATLIQPGWGFRENIGTTVLHDLSLLRKWGYLA